MSGEGPVPQAIRKLQPGKLVIASHNEGKVAEFRELLAPYGIELLSARELDLPEPEETGTTFVANAELKALSAADLSGLPRCPTTAGCAS
ncbi:non-canonical purine NTP pyrophosphatase, partial [Parvimonas sp. D9]|uniref:non-canonical purine NTP pyrophosphatase n=1 Tax=Parvimonas sp. D9 TaxID=3110689 RepID=UPI002B496366